MAAAPTPALPSGYRAESELARRPGVRVLRAFDPAGDAVVLRLETGGGAADEGRAELAVLAAVDHPGLARLVDHGALPGGGSFVARRWIEGSDLLAWSRDRGPEEIAAVVAEVCDALQHLHRQGFVHADLKPENILVTPAGSAVVVDFGLSQGTGAETPATGRVSGTLYALAPERLLGGEPTPASDLFALGALLHRLLAGGRASAQRFYARFPASSFFDAAESPPEDLPAWSRDLVAALVARDPARRPASAAAVARTLRARIGAELPPGDRAGERLRLPIDLGRERWLGAWFAGLDADGAEGLRLQWIRLGPREDPRRVQGALRLFAALRGRVTAGLVLGDELASVSDLAQLDRWAHLRARDREDPLVVAVDTADAWTLRALELLVRAASQGRGPLAPLVFVAPFEAPDGEALAAAGALEALELPALDARRLEAFLGRHLPDEDPERRSAFGAALWSAAEGSAAAADGLLDRAQREGWLLPGRDETWSLRPGPLPTAGDLAVGLDAPASRAWSDLSEPARRALAALEVCGGRAGAAEVTELCGAPAETLVELTARGVATWVGGPDGRELARVGAGWGPAAGDELLRDLHRARARQLASRAREPWRILVHRHAAGEAVEDQVLAECERLRERGCAELVLALVDGVLDADAPAPRLVLERSRAWTMLGRLDRAEQALASLVDEKGADDGGRTQALALLGRARIAAYRRDAEGALASFDAAAEHDPGLGPEVTRGRVQLLSELGRDREARETARQVLEAGAELPVRERAFLESVAAVADFRLGRVNEARGELLRLVEVARDAGDAGLEGSLRVNLATLERRAGSTEEAVRQLGRAAEVYEGGGFAAGLAHARSTLGGVLRERGDVQAAEPLLAEAMQMRERLGDPRGANTVRGMFGLALAERGHARAAIEELERSADRMEGAQRIRFAPLLLAKADEMRARIGAPPRTAHGEDGSDGEDSARERSAVDPRVFVAQARARWIRGQVDDARELALRARDLAVSLKLASVAAEAQAVALELDPELEPLPEAEAPAGTLAAEDLELRRLLEASPAELEAAGRDLAEALETRGRDDRAARLWLALAARGSGDDAAERATLALDRAGAGLADDELQALRQHLLGLPDPRPADLHDRPKEDEDWDMEVASLLEFNRRLVDQGDLPSLLGEIVDSALQVTDGERGFLVLEEEGELRFDTAHDSRRGDIAQPDFEVSTSILQQALERMEPLRLSNAVDDPLLGHTPSVVSLELRSILCVPFRVDDQLRGAIYVDHRLRTGAFGDRAERLCLLLADQAALAIRQFRRVEEIRQLNLRLERKVVRTETDLQAAHQALRAAGLRTDDTGLVGSSAAMEAVRGLIERAAPSPLVVLVTGASGTGKELAARALHSRSPRAEGPFVSESCAALPPTLIESELFGYRRGAFTGADADRAGLFERAQGGTIFLDEIGEMPLELQAKLLRVLETGEVRRLGDADTRPVDFRLVVATNRDLAHEVAEGRFRQDLYYRLDGLRVELPPLSRRTEDIPELVEHFLSLEEAKDGLPRRASKAVVARLAQRSWPGNVRELRNEVARLCVLSEGDLDDPTLVRAPDPELDTGPDADDPGEGAPRTLAELERQAILQAIEYAGGDKRRAAELLGISRAKVYQRLKEWGEGV